MLVGTADIGRDNFENGTVWARSLLTLRDDRRPRTVEFKLGERDAFDFDFSGTHKDNPSVCGAR